MNKQTKQKLFLKVFLGQDVIKEIEGLGPNEWQMIPDDGVQIVTWDFATEAEREAFKTGLRVGVGLDNYIHVEL